MFISEVLNVYKPIHGGDQIMVIGDEEILHSSTRVENFEENFPDLEVKQIYIDKCGLKGSERPTLVLVVDE